MPWHTLNTHTINLKAKLKIINIVGARPNYMKIAPLMRAYKDFDGIDALLLHTGQHYDLKMSDKFFDDLKMPVPDIFLNVGSDTHARQVAKIMTGFEDVCDKEKPDMIIVAGDVNSTMACALVACKKGIKIAHLEAGLRSFDRRMPEEINRVVTDSVADLLLTPSPDADENLVNEGVGIQKIFRVGNIMIDTLYEFLPAAQKSGILDALKIFPKSYALTTLHRPSNVDDVEVFVKILSTFNEIALKIPVVFPVHPRTQKIIEQNKLTYLLKNIIITEPLGYLDFMRLMSESKFVITDSGGIQEETSVLKIPCITLRENTERPVTVTEGTNKMIGNDMEKLLHFASEAISGRWKMSKIPDLWDGKTAERVIEVLKRVL